MPNAPDISMTDFKMLAANQYLMASVVGAGTVTTASTGTVTGVSKYRALDILVNVTATGGATATLAVFIDTQFASGVWSNLAAGTLQTTAGQQVIHLFKPSVTTVMVVTADAAAGTARAIGWGDNLRVRYTISGATSTFDFAVWLNGVG